MESLSQVLSGQRHTEDALGPEAIRVPMTIQSDKLKEVLRDVSGLHRDTLARLVAEWTSFAAWLHAATGRSVIFASLFAAEFRQIGR